MTFPHLMVGEEHLHVEVTVTIPNYGPYTVKERIDDVANAELLPSSFFVCIGADAFYDETGHDVFDHVTAVTANIQVCRDGSVVDEWIDEYPEWASPLTFKKESA